MRTISKTLLITSLLSITSPFVFASDSTVYICKQGNDTFMSTDLHSLPDSCENVQSRMISELKSDPATSGLREGEQTMLKAMEAQDLARAQAQQHRYQNIDERVGASLYGRWVDFRHDQCVFYKTRIEEAQAERKDDNGLNRQIQRDLAQLPYYCR